ncbi:ABC transporter permease [Brucella endophytica]|uniref:ABC transporter permease n=2 Tax=Brucella endophytica TaxID=1963359 RepID=A0A916SMF2_9HYPH|nr:ABC transporter permease [Brucella endophytica]
MAEEPSRERISIQDMLSAMGDRAFGPLMLLFALPNLLPTPPGTSAVLGIPLIILAAQLMLGRKPWLPAVIGNRSLPRSNFAALLERAGPWLARAERLVKPRLAMLVTPPAEYAIGALCFILAIILALPIPLGNILPALAICLFSFGILERDGVWVIAGFIASLVSVSVAAGVLLALLKGLFFVIEKTFN